MIHGAARTSLIKGNRFQIWNGADRELLAEPVTLTSIYGRALFLAPVIPRDCILTGNSAAWVWAGNGNAPELLYIASPNRPRRAQDSRFWIYLNKSARQLLQPQTIKPLGSRRASRPVLPTLQAVSPRSLPHKTDEANPAKRGSLFPKDAPTTAKIISLYPEHSPATIPDTQPREKSMKSGKYPKEAQKKTNNTQKYLPGDCLQLAGIHILSPDATRDFCDSHPNLPGSQTWERTRLKSLTGRVFT
ncbi:hypothetical protein [Varibaculum sp.]|uniref:hypothetical protein n=1 Tax=Varibaculum sp. TaxID=1895474 RepID=UPI0025FD9D1B|nr:hypothetical protein [Varibaculum sp.]